MPRSRTGRPPGRRPRRAPEDAGFGGGPEDVPAFEVGRFGETPEPPAPELLALGAPPADAAAIQKWHYQALSTMAWLVLKDENLSSETRMKRFGALTLAAARHYPEAAKYDLAQQISRDAMDTASRRRAKAAARLERRSAGGAKVIPIRRDAQGS